MGEPTQPGNPHKLTRNQHIIPAESIRRFVGADGKVAFRLCGKSGEQRVRPESKLFGTDRLWDQRAEDGYMKGVEDDFQGIADRITGGLSSFRASETKAITRFFVLWAARRYLAQSPMPDYPIKGVAGEILTKDQEESLESIWGTFVRPDRTMPARFIAGANLQKQIEEHSYKLFGGGWGIVRALVGDFICPDNYGELPALPISPGICLVWGRLSVSLSKPGVAALNQFVRRSAKRYYFARHISRCPM